jgi:hypothetical protein
MVSVLILPVERGITIPEMTETALEWMGLLSCMYTCDINRPYDSDEGEYWNLRVFVCMGHDLG